jgi:hypothetical protein
MEARVGITQFLTDGPSFYGTIKHIPEDFVVTEIGPDGNPVTLIPEPEP